MPRSKQKQTRRHPNPNLVRRMAKMMHADEVENELMDKTEYEELERDIQRTYESLARRLIRQVVQAQERGTFYGKD